MKFFLTAILIITLTSCSVFKDKEKAETQTVDQMYNEAVDSLNSKKYEKAIEKFEELERTYPYSKWSTKAQIMSAYASYKNEQYDDTLITLERFVKLHPGNKDIAYAYYLRALSFYEQISDVGRDQSYSSYAKSALKEVIARFPTSKYATDAKFKLDLVNDHLAGKEVTVGRFYLKKGNHAGAINRFKKVIEEYNTTSHVPEALYRLVESYISLGVKDEAIKYASVLGYNFPENKWYERAYYLIEGKKPVKSDKNKGKWHDFKNWTGMTFFTNEPEEKDNSQLIEDYDNTIVEKQNYDKKTPTPQLKEKSGLFDKIKGWFSNDDEDSEEISEE